jgi:hypothetical protein
MRSFYQDRLGTNTGKVEETGVFIAAMIILIQGAFAGLMSQVRVGAKQTTDAFMALFLSRCFSKPVMFAKTGSGQTNETKITHLNSGASVCLLQLMSANRVGEQEYLIKNGLVKPFLYKNDHFAKTGSGQTYGKHSQKRPFPLRYLIKLAQLKAWMKQVRTRSF